MIILTTQSVITKFLGVHRKYGILNTFTYLNFPRPHSQIPGLIIILPPAIGLPPAAIHDLELPVRLIYDAP